MSEELKRFRRVLKVRKTEQELIEAELAAQRQAEEKLLQRIQEIRHEIDVALDEFCSCGEERLFSPRELWFQRQNLDVMEQSFQKNCAILELYRVEIIKTEQKLLEKHKDYRLMEQYVDTIAEGEQKRLLLEEQNRLDDMTSVRYARALREGGRG